MKHIMLFFLSKFHRTKTQEFQHSFYKMDDGFCFDCIQTNESAIDYLSSRLAATNERLESLFYFSTNLTRETLPVKVDGNCYEKTHEEWFIQRITEKYPLLQDNFYGIPYDETKDTDESIRQVMIMAERIKDYMTVYPDEEICLHADMTGGFRHASMMMLSVMQLLKFSSVRIGNVVYSNWQRSVVEDVTEVHRMFTLVSGTDEFVNFGSVTEIQQYFKDRAKTPALENLLITMQEFSEAVKICRTSKIETQVRKLQQSITDFSAETEKPLHEELFSQIITILGKEYGKLLEPDVSRIDIIRWCVNKGFLQQAMTLCTEWIPFVLVEKKICYTDDPEIQTEALASGEGMNRAWEQSLIINYNKMVNNDEKEEKQLTIPECSDKFRLAVRNYLNGVDIQECANTLPQSQEQLLQLFKECKTLNNVLKMVQNQEISVTQFHSKAPMIEKACRLLWRKLVLNDNNYGASYIKFLRSLKNTDVLVKRIGNLPETDYIDLLEIKDGKPENKRPNKKIKNEETKWQNRQNEYESMFKSGVMKTDYPEHAIHLLRGYFDLRMERNHINHAEGNGITKSRDNSKIEEMIKQYISELQHIDNN